MSVVEWPTVFLHQQNRYCSFVTALRSNPNTHQQQAAHFHHYRAVRSLQKPESWLICVQADRRSPLGSPVVAVFRRAIFLQGDKNSLSSSLNKQTASKPPVWLFPQSLTASLRQTERLHRSSGWPEPAWRVKSIHQRLRKTAHKRACFEIIMHSSAHKEENLQKRSRGPQLLARLETSAEKMSWIRAALSAVPVN